MEDKEVIKKAKLEVEYALNGLGKAYEDSYNFPKLTREHIKKVEGILESLVMFLE